MEAAARQPECCFYQLFRTFADRRDRGRYDCKRCLPDDLNRRCAWFLPILVVEFDVVADEEGRSPHGARGLKQSG